MWKRIFDTIEEKTALRNSNRMQKADGFRYSNSGPYRRQEYSPERSYDVFNKNAMMLMT